MKKSILIACMILLFALLLSGCGNSETPTETTTETTTAAHTHEWQDVSGEHAAICAVCNEKVLKPEAHDWVYQTTQNDCWSTTIINTCSICHEEQWIHGDFVLPNHEWTEETADGKTVYTCTRCHDSDTLVSEIADFSYAQVLETHKIGDPGVKHENFFLDWEIEIKNGIDAVVKAKYELAIQQDEYDTVAVSYDQDADVWCVRFYTASIPGGDQSVYLKGNGMTCYIVHGE